MSTTNVLITGANRGLTLSCTAIDFLNINGALGLGRALLQTYLAKPNHIVVGAVRDVATARSQGLEDLPVASGSKLILVKIDSASFSDPAKAVKELQYQGIARLDIVIANAGIAGKNVVPIADGDTEDFVNILAVNVIGPYALFAATKPLLDQSTQAKWASISSGAASLANHDALFAALGGRPMQAGYGASKAALNHFSLNLHSENPKLTVLVVDPGFLDTDMGKRGAKTFGIDKPPHETAENARGIVKQIDAATRETHSGKFLNYNGEPVPW
ncbi:NAD(P)-binding protein [Paramyrothecium foliicola]|nr:NAD(P)-binding protein [Paramyrothecium foliicola]